MIPHPRTIQNIIKEIQGRKPLELHDGMLLIKLADGSHARAWELDKTGHWGVTKGTGGDSIKNLVLWQVPTDVVEESYTVPVWEPADKLLVTDLKSGAICKLQHRGTAWENWPAHLTFPNDWAVHNARWDIDHLTLQGLRDRFIPHTEE